MAIKRFLAVGVLASLSNICADAALAERHISGDEVKNLRQLSQAILVSRLNEKKGLEADIEAERRIVKEMDDALDSIESTLRKELMQVTATSLDLQNSTPNSHSQTHSRNRKQQALTDALLVMSNKRHLLETKMGVQPAQLATASSSANMVRNINSKRKKHIYKAAQEMESALKRMQQKGVNLKEVMALRSRLKTSRKLALTTKVRPTLQTRTKHRH